LKKKLLLFSFLIVCLSAFAQQQISTFNLSHLNDFSRLNPAYIGDSRFELTILPFSSNIYSNGPTYRDFIGKRGEGNVLTYPSNKLNFEQGNSLNVGSVIETFRFVYNTKNWSISLHHGSTAKGIIDYSGALLSVAIQGNAPFIGQSIPLDTDFSVFSYEEIGIGGAFKKGGFTIGGRLKYLSGHSAAITRRSKVSLLTEDDIYQLSLNTDIAIDIAGQKGSALEKFNFGPLDLDFSNEENVLIKAPSLLFNLNNDLFNFSGNHGVGFDLGLSWKINDQWLVNLSALDFGKINWKDSPRNYTTKETFEFDGLSLGKLTFDGAEIFSFDELQDSLDILNFSKTSESFSTTLPAQFYLGVSFDLSKQWRFGGTVYHTNFQNTPFTALSLGANYQLHETFNIGISYSAMNEESFLLGINAAFDVGPVQLFVVTDNIVSAFKVEESRTLNARVGLSFSFGALEVPE